MKKKTGINNVTTGIVAEILVVALFPRSKTATGIKSNAKNYRLLAAFGEEYRSLAKKISEDQSDER